MRLQEVAMADVALHHENRILLPEPVLRRFYEKVVVDLDTGCWNWTGTKTKRGYGLFPVPDLGPREVHKIAYEHFVGPVPKDLELGHITQGDKCAFWEHVRPITHEQNMREARGHTDTEFGCGHPRVVSNTYHNTRGYDECRAKTLNAYWTARGKPHKYADWATRYYN